MPVVLIRFLRAVAVLLLAGQAVVLQAHQHGPARWGASAAAAGARTTPSPQRPDDPLGCPVCREVAQGAAYLSPAPPSFLPPDDDEAWTPVVTPPARAVERRSHSWRSRAPPAPLHA